MAVRIRPAAEADLPALLALYGELHPEDPPVSVQTRERAWREISAQAGRTILIAEVDGALAGTADCSVLANLSRGARPFMLIENVVVAAAHRRRGVGSGLMDAALTLARSGGCYKVQLLSRADRAEAHAFYESCGFQPSAQGYRQHFRPA